MESVERGRLKVNFTPEAEEELRFLVEKQQLDFYKSFEEVKELIE